MSASMIKSLRDVEKKISRVLYCRLLKLQGLREIVQETFYALDSRIAILKATRDYSTDRYYANTIAETSERKRDSE